MVVKSNKGTWLINGKWCENHQEDKELGYKGTITSKIFSAHNKSKKNDGNLHIVFDALASHDITYVGIVQTARASGMKKFPLPYVLTNCHNSLCAVGGTINEDDHVFGLSAAKKYGGDFVPPHLAVIHQYVREMLAGCGKMILGSDSHTRYGALGTMGFGEGGPELVKQLLGRTYDIAQPKVVAVWLEGAPKPGVGPQDVAIALIKEVFESGFVKNKILEFLGPGIANLSVDYRLGIDVMTTETTCLSSIWQTDSHVENWLTIHGRSNDYEKLIPSNKAYYESVIKIDLSSIDPMIALPFHPSNAWSINEFLDNAPTLLKQVEEEAKDISGGKIFGTSLQKKLRNGAFFVDQCIVAGCSGGIYENIVRVSEIVNGHTIGYNGIDLSVYPASQAQNIELVRQGYASILLEAGAVMKTAFCGPCFGAGDVPANTGFSIRHTTRNFPNREGSKPTENQISYVALMDARSIAATAINGGRLTAATDLDNIPEEKPISYRFDQGIYDKRVYMGVDLPNEKQELVFGPNIADWPAMIPMTENILLVVASAIFDPVTTTDELIPSGETSSYRSNPMKLAEFTLSRKDPNYVERAKKIYDLELDRRKSSSNIKELFKQLSLEDKMATTGIGSVIFAVKPGDGSAREQAASCQKILGGWANIAEEYATKRYRSNLINWGMIPFILPDGAKHKLQPGDHILVMGIRDALKKGKDSVEAILYRNNLKEKLFLLLPDLSSSERTIILSGCLINYYGQGN